MSISLITDFLLRIFTKEDLSIILTDIIIILSTLYIWRFIIEKQFKELGLTNIKIEYKLLIKGLLLGIVGNIFLFISMLIKNDIKIENSILNFNYMYLIAPLITCMFIGFAEEVWLRGLLISFLRTKLKFNAKISILISSVIFTLFHLSDSLFDLSFIFLFGILFAYMYIKTSSLWLSIGFHVIWDFFQTAIFKLSPSKLSYDTMFHTKIINNDWTFQALIYLIMFAFLFYVVRRITLNKVNVV